MAPSYASRSGSCHGQNYPATSQYEVPKVVRSDNRTHDDFHGQEETWGWLRLTPLEDTLVIDRDTFMFFT